MPRDYWQEAVFIRDEVAACFRETLLGRDHRPILILAVMNLHLLAQDIKKARDPTKRRNQIREFDRGKSAVKSIIRRAYNETKHRRIQNQPNPKSATKRAA